MSSIQFVQTGYTLRQNTGRVVLRNPAQMTAQRGPDRVEISGAARLLSRMPADRRELIERIQREISSGTYDTLDKIDAVVDKVYEDISR